MIRVVGSYVDGFGVQEGDFIGDIMWELQIYRLWLNNEYEEDCLERIFRVYFDKYLYVRNMLFV